MLALVLILFCQGELLNRGADDAQRVPQRASSQNRSGQSSLVQRETTAASERGDQVTSKTIYFVFYVAFANSIGRLLHSHWLYQGSCKREGQRWRSLRSRSGCCWTGRRRRTWLLTMDSASTGRWIVQSDFQCFLVRHIDICSMAYDFVARDNSRNKEMYIKYHWERVVGNEVGSVFACVAREMQ